MDPLALKVIGTILVIVGIAGTVLPVLPGVPVVFAGLALAAWADDFQRVGAITLVILGLLTALAVIADIAASAFVGIFFGLPGIVVGPFLGAVAGELSANRALLHAGRAGLGTWLGLLLGSIAKLTLAFLMLGVFATAYLISA